MPAALGYFRFKTSSGAARHWPITKTKVTIGRAVEGSKKEKADLRIHAHYMSGVHAILTYEDGRFYIEDVSINGTTVNGTFLHRQKIPLDEGDAVSFKSKFPQGTDTYLSIFLTLKDPYADPSPTYTPETLPPPNTTAQDNTLPEAAPSLTPAPAFAPVAGHSTQPGPVSAIPPPTPITVPTAVSSTLPPPSTPRSRGGKLSRDPHMLSQLDTFVVSARDVKTPGPAKAPTERTAGRTPATDGARRVGSRLPVALPLPAFGGDKPAAGGSAQPSNGKQVGKDLESAAPPSTTEATTVADTTDESPSEPNDETVKDTPEETVAEPDSEDLGSSVDGPSIPKTPGSEPADRSDLISAALWSPDGVDPPRTIVTVEASTTTTVIKETKRELRLDPSLQATAHLLRTPSRKSVTFGPVLSPELFDKEQPAATPLKKGRAPEATPAGTRTSDTPKKPLLKRLLDETDRESSVGSSQGAFSGDQEKAADDVADLMMEEPLLGDSGSERGVHSVERRSERSNEITTPSRQDRARSRSPGPSGSSGKSPLQKVVAWLGFGGWKHEDKEDAESGDFGEGATTVEAEAAAVSEEPQETPLQEGDEKTPEESAGGSTSQEWDLQEVPQSDDSDVPTSVDFGSNKQSEPSHSRNSSATSVGADQTSAIANTDAPEPADASSSSDDRRKSIPHMSNVINDILHSPTPLAIQDFRVGGRYSTGSIPVHLPEAEKVRGRMSIAVAGVGKTLEGDAEEETASRGSVPPQSADGSVAEDGLDGDNDADRDEDHAKPSSPSSPGAPADELLNSAIASDSNTESAPVITEPVLTPRRKSGRSTRGTSPAPPQVPPDAEESEVVPSNEVDGAVVSIEPEAPIVDEVITPVSLEQGEDEKENVIDAEKERSKHEIPAGKTKPGRRATLTAPKGSGKQVQTGHGRRSMPAKHINVPDAPKPAELESPTPAAALGDELIGEGSAEEPTDDVSGTQPATGLIIPQEPPTTDAEAEGSGSVQETNVKTPKGRGRRHTVHANADSRPQAAQKGRRKTTATATASTADVLPESISPSATLEGENVEPSKVDTDQEIAAVPAEATDRPIVDAPGDSTPLSEVAQTAAVLEDVPAPPTAPGTRRRHTVQTDPANQPAPELKGRRKTTTATSRAPKASVEETLPESGEVEATAESVSVEQSAPEEAAPVNGRRKTATGAVRTPKASLEEIQPTSTEEKDGKEPEVAPAPLELAVPTKGRRKTATGRAAKASVEDVQATSAENIDVASKSDEVGEPAEVLESTVSESSAPGKGPAKGRRKTATGRAAKASVDEVQPTVSENVDAVAEPDQVGEPAEVPQTTVAESSPSEVAGAPSSTPSGSADHVPEAPRPADPSESAAVPAIYDATRGKRRHTVHANAAAPSQPAPRGRRKTTAAAAEGVDEPQPAVVPPESKTLGKRKLEVEVVVETPGKPEGPKTKKARKSIAAKVAEKVEEVFIEEPEPLPRRRGAAGKAGAAEPVEQPAKTTRKRKAPVEESEEESAVEAVPSKPAPRSRKSTKLDTPETVDNSSGAGRSTGNSSTTGARGSGRSLKGKEAAVVVEKVPSVKRGRSKAPAQKAEQAEEEAATSEVDIAKPVARRGRQTKAEPVVEEKPVAAVAPATKTTRGKKAKGSASAPAAVEERKPTVRGKRGKEAPEVESAPAKLEGNQKATLKKGGAKGAKDESKEVPPSGSVVSSSRAAIAAPGKGRVRAKQELEAEEPAVFPARGRSRAKQEPEVEQPADVSEVVAQKGRSAAKGKAVVRDAAPVVEEAPPATKGRGAKAKVSKDEPAPAASAVASKTGKVTQASVKAPAKTTDIIVEIISDSRRGTGTVEEPAPAPKKGKRAAPKQDVEAVAAPASKKRRVGSAKDSVAVEATKPAPAPARSRATVAKVGPSNAEPVVEKKAAVRVKNAAAVEAVEVPEKPKKAAAGARIVARKAPTVTSRASASRSATRGSSAGRVSRTGVKTTKAAAAGAGAKVAAGRATRKR
ncbi:hypothetical protein M427DRAFT_47144 [Gonapodya prolifera JEL478]|uniref:FHA domain-containing protein n=1 Tax=Gonapodya prolifera (strain JEL478) TaxID=1344416 RepID=A0A139A3L2_GONPJ|nr:hypothetical protein M427DRAFT_47144 [Gonapodya prolifera JEL478]|eukprot:KXS11406.1 hypothetical protein M427DRAFT_47144 [Gonapodya prolifera JEL478]